MSNIKIGIVAEFNPLHNGHKYLIEKAQSFIKNNGNNGDIICVMSEFFTQRGECAITNGFSRAKVAVEEGCSIVIALPYLYSVAYADDFAFKSVELLVNCGITHLIFGSEITDLETFEKMYTLEHEENFKIKYKKLLKEGYSHAKIVSKLLNLDNNLPNATLAYSYYKALKILNPAVQMIMIKREGQGLNSKNIDNNEKFLSATAIRNNLENKQIANYLPNNMLTSLQKEKTISEQDFYPFIKYKILSLGKEKLKNIYDISEGLENRIYNYCLESTNYEELVTSIATKRYSQKKIQRILLHVLFNITKEDYLKNNNPKFFRVLAVRKNKTSLIREINNKNNITLIPALNSKNSPYFDIDIRISKIYNLVAQGKDIFKHNLEIIDI